MRKAHRIVPLYLVAVKLPFYCTTKNARKAPRCKFFKIPTLTDTNRSPCRPKSESYAGVGRRRGLC